MFFFFFFNNENRIGFKKLTNADLGLSSSSNQTHIGLWSNVLEFLDDTDVVKSAMLIYDTYCDILKCSFDRIKTPEGKYRSPKIRIGEDINNSIVFKIREFARQDPNAEWYLAWTGLESKELVFWLIKSGSEDYQIAQTLFPNNESVLEESSPTYNSAKEFLLKRINFVSIDVQKDIEVKSQLGDNARIYKSIDIEKAQRLFNKTGKDGEELIAQYLEREKKAGNIHSFIWENKSKESGLPYDFIIDNNQFVDVKSTRFDFEQYIYFSSSEIDFALTKTDLSYSVYRVFDMNKDEIKLRICNNCKEYMDVVHKPIEDVKKEMESHRTLLDSLKIGVKPTDCFINIQNSITL